MNVSTGRRPLRASAVLACVSALASMACATEPISSPPPKLPDPGADGEYETSLPKPPPSEPLELHVRLGAELARCEVDEPHFFFDESEPRPQAMPELERVASCLSVEPFSQSDVVLIGRADQRGSEEYNRELGMRRAEFVKEQLIEHGVDPERITVKSRGEQDSIGDQPIASHGYDRRVDIVQLFVIAP